MNSDLPSLSTWVGAAAAAVHQSGGLPLAVLDVDLTLIDNAPRNRAIWAAWLHEVRHRFPGAALAAVRAQTMPIVFGVRENLAALGVSAPDLVDAGFRFWLETFFTGRFAACDVALPGAVDAVRALRHLDVTIVYLTARPAALHAATVEKFTELGLPLAGPGAILVMKDREGEGDRAFKERALRWIGSVGTPILCADNEPGHVNAMQLAFPGARNMHVETRWSAGAPELIAAARRAPSLLAGLRGDP